MSPKRMHPVIRSPNSRLHPAMLIAASIICSLLVWTIGCLDDTDCAIIATVTRMTVEGAHSSQQKSDPCCSLLNKMSAAEKITVQLSTHRTHQPGIALTPVVALIAHFSTEYTFRLGRFTWRDQPAILAEQLAKRPSGLIPETH